MLELDSSGLLPPFLKKDRSSQIAILGFGPTRDAFVKGDSWAVWGLAHDPEACFHDVLFEMHDPSLWEALHSMPSPRYIEKLNSYRASVYMRKRHSGIQNSVPYPMSVAKRWFREPPQSSIAWIMQAAILSGPRTIGLWGVDMEIGSDYAYQRANLRYLLGFAVAHDIRIFLPDGEKLTDGDEDYGSTIWFKKHPNALRNPT